MKKTVISQRGLAEHWSVLGRIRDRDRKKMNRHPCFISFFEIELKGTDGWTKLNYVEEFETSVGSVKDNVPRQDCNKISKSEFVEKFEKPRVPVVLTHTMDHWKGMRKWTVEVL